MHEKYPSAYILVLYPVHSPRPEQCSRSVPFLVELKATPELSFAVASPDLRREGAYETAGDRGSACTVFGLVKELLSESVVERTGSCAGIGVASVQGRP